MSAAVEVPQRGKARVMRVTNRSSLLRRRPVPLEMIFFARLRRPAT
jgi:hypothetical protein